MGAKLVQSHDAQIDVEGRELPSAWAAGSSPKDWACPRFWSGAARPIATTSLDAGTEDFSLLPEDGFGIARSCPTHKHVYLEALTVFQTDFRTQTNCSAKLSEQVFVAGMVDLG